MRQFIAALFTLFLLSANPACAARGFGATFGVGSTDSLNSAYTTATAAQASLSAWIWINGAGGGSQGVVLRRDTTTYGLWMNASTASMQWAANFSGNNGDWTWTAPSTGAWHHIAVTYDGSSTANKPTVYIDGATVSVTVNVAPIGTLTQVLSGTYIGNRADGMRNWDGKLAEVAYWAGSLLTANEVKALSRGVSPLKIKAASLALYYPLYGKQTNEPSWGSSLSLGTMTGTAFQPHSPTSAYPLIWNNGR
jgi:hypothetical protein